MTRSIFAAAALAASFAALPTVAHATSYTCKCDANFAPTVGSGALNKDGNNFTCDQTWTDNSTGHDTGGYNQYVKFSFPDAVVQGSSTNVKFAVRATGECLMIATDAVNSHKEWTGTKCDDSNLNVNDFNFDSSGNGLSTIAGQMNTTTKSNKFVAFYKDKTSTEHHLAAVCAQDR